MKIGVLIPTRNRPEFLAHALYLLENQSLQPDEIEVVDDFTMFDFPDVTWRYKAGIERLRYKGCDLILCWEDDDWYHWDYIRSMVTLWKKSNSPNLFGLNKTVYYHVVKRVYQIINHPGRSSMMSMLIRTDFDIPFCDDNYQYLDYHLWTKYRGSKIAVIPERFINIGIKHGIGNVAGGGHKKYAIYHNEDFDCSFLKSTIIDKESFLFYAGFYKAD